MKTERKSAKAVVVMLVLSGVWTSATAGNLEPSAAPAPTMKTLDEVEPRTAIHASDLPLTINESGSYYFAEDIDFEPNDVHAITVECNDVTIDLMGYTLKGPDSGSTAGVYMYGSSNVEVRNGTIRDFGYPAIYEGNTSTSRGHRVINMRLVSNWYGVLLNGTGHQVRNCIAAANSGSGIYAGNCCVASGNTCYENGETGIYVGVGSEVTGNICYNNLVGISAADGSMAIGNNCYNNNSNGITVGLGGTVTSNTCYDNGNNGINTDGGCTVTGNTTRDNTGKGISTQDHCLVDQNTAFNNTGGNLSTGGGSVLGVNVY